MRNTLVYPITYDEIRDRLQNQVAVVSAGEVACGSMSGLLFKAADQIVGREQLAHRKIKELLVTATASSDDVPCHIVEAIRDLALIYTDVSLG